MILHTQHVRRQYWIARFAGVIYSHVGEGRTEREAIGDLLKRAHDVGNVHGLAVIRQPDGPCVKLRVGEKPKPTAIVKGGGA